MIELPESMREKDPSFVGTEEREIGAQPLRTTSLRGK